MSVAATAAACMLRLTRLQLPSRCCSGRWASTCAGTPAGSCSSCGACFCGCFSCSKDAIQLVYQLMQAHAGVCFQQVCTCMQAEL
jgi:ABC-type cobalamin transport system permease subunit